MSFEQNSTQKPAAFAYLTIAAFAFVVGSLVTYQFVVLSGPARIAAGKTPLTTTQEQVTRQSAGAVLDVSPALSEAQPTDPSVVEFIPAKALRTVTKAAIAGAYDIQPRVGDEPQAGRITFRTAAAQEAAVAIDDALQQAFASGALITPTALTLEGGGIDGRTLIFKLIQDALQSGDATSLQAARDMRRSAFAASNARTQEIGGERYYVVESGDSLGFISLQFYGQTDAYEKIFSANQDVLGSPDQIRAGQRLRIPG